MKCYFFIHGQVISNYLFVNQQDIYCRSFVHMLRIGYNELNGENDEIV